MEQFELLPKRPKPLKNESLTSFIMQMAKANKITCVDLLIKIRNGVGRCDPDKKLTVGAASALMYEKGVRPVAHVDSLLQLLDYV